MFSPALFALPIISASHTQSNNCMSAKQTCELMDSYNARKRIKGKIRVTEYSHPNWPSRLILADFEKDHEDSVKSLTGCDDITLVSAKKYYMGVREFNELKEFES
jgi:hypothetical protein